MASLDKKYDVVILTHGPKDDLVLSLENIFRQSNKPMRVIIYNTDKSIFYSNIKEKARLEKILKKTNVIKVDISLKSFDHGKARNDALKYTKSNHVLFMTDDAIPYDKNLCKNLLSGFKDSKVAAVYARQIAKTEAPLKEKYVREYNYPNKDIVKDKSTEKDYGIKNIFCSNSCCMYDKKILKKLHGFKEKLTQNEDTLYAYKAIEKGYKIVYKADAKVYHSHNLSYIEQFKRNRDIGLFQKQNKEIYDKFPAEHEGIRLVKYVTNKLMKKGKIINACDFIIECGFRYIGFKFGKI